MDLTATSSTPRWSRHSSLRRNTGSDSVLDDRDDALLLLRCRCYLHSANRISLPTSPQKRMRIMRFLANWLVSFGGVSTNLSRPRPSLSVCLHQNEANVGVGLSSPIACV